MADLVTVETSGGVARIQLNRPDAANALDLPLASALRDAVGRVAEGRARRAARQRVAVHDARRHRGEAALRSRVTKGGSSTSTRSTAVYPGRMSPRIAALLACAALASAACRTESAPQETASPASRPVRSAELPEIRYYMIADT